MKTIFIVEDDEGIRDLLTYVFRSVCYSVIFFVTGGEFREALEKSLPDLILIDVMLPDVNGLHLCRELKADPVAAQIPVLLMSADLTNREKSDQVDAQGFISKPFDIHAFTNKIGEFIG